LFSIFIQFRSSHLHLVLIKMQIAPVLHGKLGNSAHIHEPLALALNFSFAAINKVTHRPPVVPSP
jgi:hypothetical protein